jgi:putative restriction endonuclease
VLDAWDRQCAFCGYDGQFAGASVGIEAAHVRWFAFNGPDSLDNGLALCSLHHKLFDLGMLGLSNGKRVMVSARFSARTLAGRAIYDLHGRALSPRPGTALPATNHVSWHAQQVFKGDPLAA